MAIFVTAVTVALVVSFLCSVFESVLLSISSARVEALADAGKRSGRMLRNFKRSIDVPIAAILIVNTVAHTIGATVAGASYVDQFGEQTLWLFSIIFTIAVLLLTEIIPKTLGVTYADVLASPVAYSIKFLTVLLGPLVTLAAWISRAMRGRRKQPSTSVDDIRLLAALGRREGIVGARTAEIIMGATQLGQLCAADIAVPRQNVTLLSGEQSLDDMVTTIRDSGYSRFPYSPTGALDDVTGIILAKDFLLALQSAPGDSPRMSEQLREPLTTPASVPLNALLRIFRESRQHLAVVVDDYGDAEGIVTLEDILEELVGEIMDESDQPEEDMQKAPDGSIIARADVELRKVCDHFGSEWKRDLSVTSLGGLVMHELERIPVSGDVLEWNGLRVEVLQATETGPEELRVSKSPAT
jgi:CBS domain containing-hemolysin-like protein